MVTTSDLGIYIVESKILEEVCHLALSARGVIDLVPLLPFRIFISDIFKNEMHLLNIWW